MMLESTEMLEPTATDGAPAGPQWCELVGEVVVLDLRSPFVCVGKLVCLAGEFLVLDAADLHDLRDTSTTRERYVRDCFQHGVTPNRRRAWVNLRELVSVSRLADVIVE